MKSVILNNKISFAGGSKRFTLIAGPCAIENQEMAFEVALKLKKITGIIPTKIIVKAGAAASINRSSEAY